MDAVLDYFKDLNDPIFINIFIGVNVLSFILYLASLIEGNSSQTVNLIFFG